MPGFVRDVRRAFRRWAGFSACASIWITLIWIAAVLPGRPAIHRLYPFFGEAAVLVAFRDWTLLAAPRA